MFLYFLLLFVYQPIFNGLCETPKASTPTSLPRTTQFLYGRAVCQHYEADGNRTRPELIICPKGIKHCFSSAYVIKDEKSFRLKIHMQGCWSKSEVGRVKCSVGSCLIGKSVNSDVASSLQKCCCRGFACNKNTSYSNSILQKKISHSIGLFASSQTPAKRKPSRIKDISPKETIILGVISSVFATFLILSIVFVSWRCAARKNETNLPKKPRQSASAVEERVQYSTISNDDIAFGDLINKGSFSTVWKCDYDGAKAAVKIFTAENDSYWKNERKIYDVLGVHPNIAVILAGVELVSPFSRRKALIMTFYSCGSLLQYLKSHILTWDEMYKLILSLANGVSFIHGEIDEYESLKRKVVVHRNLNSCNVLVKEDGTCALSAFGFAAHITDKNVPETVVPESLLYTPPEVLADAVNWHDWESSLKQVDVYAIGLIFWEIVARCQCFYNGGTIPNASLPYVAELGEKPSVAVLEEYIAKQRKRPIFPLEGQKSDRSFSLLTNTIEECWDVEAEARLTALCVVKRMQEIHDVRYDDVDGVKNEATVVVGNDINAFEFCPYTASKPAVDSPKATFEATKGISLLHLRINECEMLDGSLPSNGSRQACHHNGNDEICAVTETLLQNVEVFSGCANV